MSYDGKEPLHKVTRDGASGSEGRASLTIRLAVAKPEPNMLLALATWLLLTRLVKLLVKC